MNDYTTLIAAAKQARLNAHAPFSNFRVGAALRAKSGRIFTGCNVENATLGLTCCAERVAIFKAVSEGEARIRSHRSGGGYRYAHPALRSLPPDYLGILRRCSGGSCQPRRKSDRGKFRKPAAASVRFLVFVAEAFADIQPGIATPPISCLREFNFYPCPILRLRFRFMADFFSVSGTFLLEVSFTKSGPVSRGIKCKEISSGVLGLVIRFLTTP